MGTTPKYKLPWPEMNEPSDGPGGYRKLAEATETALNGHDTAIKAITGVQFIATPHGNGITATAYPNGVSLMYMTSVETGAGWPVPGASALVVTFKDTAATQYFHRLDTTKPESWFRTMGTTANSVWHQVGAASHRVQYDTASVNVNSGAWSGIGIKTLEFSEGSDIVAFGNGMKVNRAGTYQADLLIQSGNGTAVTVTIGIGITGAPSSINRVSQFANASSVITVGTWLLKLAAGATVTGYVSHTNAGVLAFSNRRLALRRVGN